MTINDSVLHNDEKIIFALRELYRSSGYMPFRMSKFEEYDLYAGNKDFLVSDNVITFTDTNGKLMALKPDVTLSIIKGSRDLPQTVQRVYYNENVYRVSKNTHSYKEIMQAGLECFGNVTSENVTEVIELAGRSLRKLSENSVLDISDLSLLEETVRGTEIPYEAAADVYKAIGEKNTAALKKLCEENGVQPEAAAKLVKLAGLHGTIGEVLPEAEKTFGDSMAFRIFRDSISMLEKSDIAGMLRIDFSVVGDTNYYNGLIFKGFVEGVPNAVLSGGQYDKLMQKLRRTSKAVGFAIYLDALERVEIGGGDEGEEERQYLNIALPKGRLGEKVYAMFAAAGYECPSLLEPNRKLIFENPEKKVRYFWVKPSDVAIYVERGAADIGVAGKDILLEYEPDVYELCDLGIGKCAMCVAAPKSFTDNGRKTLRVATKFSNIAQNHYRSIGRDIDIVHLNGSIEIAPILGLTDVIVDIVETGATLRENDLEVKERIVPISARLIANKSSYKFKCGVIERITAEMEKASEEKQ